MFYPVQPIILAEAGAAHAPAAAARIIAIVRMGNSF
jgi:hypothetical protein